MTVVAQILDDKGQVAAKEEIADTMIDLLAVWGDVQTAFSWAMEQLRDETRSRHVNAAAETVLPTLYDTEEAARVEFEAKWPAKEEKLDGAIAEDPAAEAEVVP